MLDGDVRLVSCMAVNNEIGTAQPLLEIGRLIRRAAPKAVFHVDAVQAFTKGVLPWREAAIDLISLSAHKVHGPKGVGALVRCRDLELEPLLHGGGQEELKEAARRLDREWGAKGVHVRYIPDLYYRSQAQVRDYLRARGLEPGRHAGIADTSELMFLDKERRWIREDRLAPGGENTGVEGDPRRASAELGGKFLEIKVGNAVAQIRRLLPPDKSP